MSPVILLFFFIIVSANSLRCPYPKVNEYSDCDEDPGSPLFLTPYIEQGNIEEARNLSRVIFSDFPEIKSYAGFITVDKIYNSNQFFWYFPAEQERTGTLKSALYLWLQGGPGGSSLFGLFDENGAFEVKDNKLQLRDLYWSKNDHVIYIDNPVGTGFSFTNDTRGYCTNQTQIGEHLYSTLIQFFQLFPELQTYDFIVSGESYAGKYIPALGYTIHEKNPTANIKINLKGLMIGNGWSDPINQLDYGDYLYQIGLLDRNQKKEVEDLQTQTAELIKKELWSDADEMCQKIYMYIISCMGNVSIYNYMKSELEDCDYCQYIQKVSTRKSIHVGNLTYHEFSLVRQYLRDDIMQSVTPWISELLEHYHMLFYNGQVDIIVAYPLTLKFLTNLKFSGREDYLKAARETLMYEDTSNNETVLAGYMKAAVDGKLMDAMIRSAGHMVPTDQPASMLTLMDTWRRHWSKILL